MSKILNVLSNKIIAWSIVIIDLFFMKNTAYASNVGKFSGSDLSPITGMVNKYLGVAALFITVFALGAFIYNIVRLGMSSTNAFLREQAVRGIMISGAVAALIPFTGVIYYFVITLGG